MKKTQAFFFLALFALILSTISASAEERTEDQELASSINRVVQPKKLLLNVKMYFPPEHQDSALVELADHVNYYLMNYRSSGMNISSKTFPTINSEGQIDGALTSIWLEPPNFVRDFVLIESPW